MSSETTTKKAILVDPWKGTITEHQIVDHNCISKLLQCRMFTIVHVNDTGETLYVDDEGLINGTDVAVKYRFYPVALAGRGLFLGADLSTGESIDTKLSKADVHKSIQFISDLILNTENDED